jgi:hypothetical protein
MKSKVPVSQIPSNSESAAPESDSVATAVLNEQQAAAYAGLTAHQLYLHRKKGTGPPFVMHGARIRYRFDDLKRWVAELPSFTSIAQALVANPARAEGARRQRATTAIARKARWDKHQDSATDDA